MSIRHLDLGEACSLLLAFACAVCPGDHHFLGGGEVGLGRMFLVCNLRRMLSCMLHHRGCHLRV